jgi:hypothetical protein
MLSNATQMARIMPLLLVTSLSASCGDRSNDASGTTVILPSSRPQAVTPMRTRPGSKPSSTKPVPPWDATSCGDDEYRNARMERHPELIGRTAEDLFSAYGRPQGEDRFRAGDGVGTYSGGWRASCRAARRATRERPYARSSGNAPGATSSSASERPMARGASSMHRRMRISEVNPLGV